MGVITCVLLFAALPLAQERPLGPPPPPPAPPTGTARISGQVVAADTDTPVKRATVSIVGRSGPVSGRAPSGITAGITSGVPGGVVGGVQMSLTPSGAFGGGQSPPWTQVTDDAGRFEFCDLPGGVYSIMASPRSGFVRAPRPQQVEVADGKSATITFRLERTGVITGRLLDESGDPIPRARVSATRRDRMSGRLMPVGPDDTTDDLGQFRLFDLPPGEYVVSGNDNYYGPTNAAGPSQGYAPTFFPGSVSIDGARLVAVRSGQETPGIEFSLVRVAMGRVTGTLRDSSGQPVTSRGSVNLSSRERGALGFGRGTGARPDGTFVITNIPPGDYYLVASVQLGDGRNAAREGVYVPVSVSGNEVAVDLQTNKGAVVRGRVVVEGTPPALPPAIAARAGLESPRITVFARPEPTGGGLGMVSDPSRPVTPDENGTFELTGVRGPVLLIASGTRMAFKSVVRGADDLTARPIEFKGTERTSNITIVLTYDVGSIEGVVTNDRGEPLPAAAVIVFPEDEARWFQGSPFVHVSRSLPLLPASVTRPQTAQTPGLLRSGRRAPVPGSFNSPGLLPGRYLVAAFESDGMPQMDRESLERLRKEAVVATVTAGGSTNVQVRAMKAF